MAAAESMRVVLLVEENTKKFRPVFAIVTPIGNNRHSVSIMESTSETAEYRERGRKKVAVYPNWEQTQKYIPSADLRHIFIHGIRRVAYTYDEGKEYFHEMGARY